VPISPDQELLVGFHFGPDPAPSRHPGVVSIGLDPIEGGDHFECWWYQGDVDHKMVGNARISQCADYAIVMIQVADSAPQDFRVRAHDAYQELLDVALRSGHPHLAKIWNYFPGINDGEDDREKYRQFSIGRAEAFESFGIVDASVPTGTAVGCTRDSGLTIVALTSRYSLLSAENPRQVSAFKYPRQYGPRSPKFSRGGCVPTESHDLLVLSGTAAIIGHESVYPYDVSLQTAETLRNLGHLCEAITELSSEGPQFVLDENCVLRVYLRDPDDKDCVARQLTELLGSIESNTIFLHADICRRELMVEIDGIRVSS
jgi:chorismate lyase/3-hydroxybenzoate synthase